MPFDIDELTWHSESYKGVQRSLSDALEEATVEQVPQDGGGPPALRVQLEFNDGITKQHWNRNQRIEVEFRLADYDGTVRGTAEVDTLTTTKDSPPGFLQAELFLQVTPEVFTADDYPEELTEMP